MMVDRDQKFLIFREPLEMYCGTGGGGGGDSLAVSGGD